MPELPELVVYAERLEHHLKGLAIARVSLHDPFVLRSTAPSIDSFVGRSVVRIHRAGKQLALEVDGGTALAFHLMRAGRLHWRASPLRGRAKGARCAIEFEDGTTLQMTEAGTQHRASLRAVERVGDFLAEAGGLDPLSPEFGAAELGRRLHAESRQLKTALRDRGVVAGIGNAYADEILFAARLSPVRSTRTLDDAAIERLAGAIVATLGDWVARIRSACPEGLPTRQPDWRGAMAVHGKAGTPCPSCSGTIARISFKDSETNYCPACQNEGRLLADRRLSKFGIRRVIRRA